MDDDKVSGCQVWRLASAKNLGRSACIAGLLRCVGAPAGFVRRQSAPLSGPVSRQKCGETCAWTRHVDRWSLRQGAGRACPSSLEPSVGSLALRHPRRLQAKQLEPAQPRRRAAPIWTSRIWTGAQKPPFRSRPTSANRKPRRPSTRCRVGVSRSAQIDRAPRRVWTLRRATGRALALAARARTSSPRAVTVRSRRSPLPRSAHGGGKPAGDSWWQAKRRATIQGSAAQSPPSAVRRGFPRSRRSKAERIFCDFPGLDLTVRSTHRSAQGGKPDGSSEEKRDGAAQAVAGEL